MIDRELLDRLRTFDGGPVVSVYLTVPPGVGELHTAALRLKDLLHPLKADAAALGREAERAVLSDLERIQELSSRIGDQQGSGIAMFAGGGGTLLESVGLPAPVRNRAVLDHRPYLWPIDAMLGELRRSAAVVLDRRRAEIHRFDQGELAGSEQLDAEELRKSNYGGFAGYAERRVRTHADEVAHRHYRDTAARLYELWRAGEFDVLMVGGQTDNVDGLVAELHPDLGGRLAGTFTVDTHTVTPAIVAGHCRELLARHEAAEQTELADRVLALAKGGGLAAAGLGPVLAAVNQRAVELLVVAADVALPGRECPSCGWLAAEGDECPACGEASRAVPDLVDAIAAAVHGSSGSVRHVMVDTPLAADGVGALLRFPVPALG